MLLGVRAAVRLCVLLTLPVPEEDGEGAPVALGVADAVAEAVPERKLKLEREAVGLGVAEPGLGIAGTVGLRVALVLALVQGGALALAQELALALGLTLRLVDEWAARKRLRGALGEAEGLTAQEGEGGVGLWEGAELREGAVLWLAENETIEGGNEEK